jgi:solute carrier family 12 sodium/potassium/chloride transporter 2
MLYTVSHPISYISMAQLLTKFRIDFGDVIVISDIQKKAEDSTKQMFKEIIEPFREVKEQHGTEPIITDAELSSMKERNNRHMRLYELLQQHSKNSTMIIM